MANKSLVRTNSFIFNNLPGKGLAVLMLVFIFFGAAESQTYDYCRQASTMMKTIQKFHFSPAPVDNKFSERIFYGFFEMLDPNGRIFTQEDFSQLRQFRKKLDNEIRGNSCQFLGQAIELYRKRLLSADSLLTAMLDSPMDYSMEEEIEFGMTQEPIRFARNSRELSIRWSQWLKYQILVSAFSAEEVTGISSQDFMDIEPGIREKIRQREKCRIEKILNPPMGFDQFVASQWLKSIAQGFDPHTDFFSAYDIRLFEASISKDAYTYGIQIEENENGDIVISGIVPGSPAWNANALNKGDIILRLETFDNKSRDFMCMDFFEAYESLYSTDEQEIKLIIRKTNGQVKAVKLKKKKMEMEENMARSFILDGKKKVGYISLPGFYTQLEDKEAMGCANDVAREIHKLKNENIEGLIIDIRFNGGGSMKEALDLTSLFIDDGPVTVSMDKDKVAAVMRDTNPGTIYSGPLIVMVNSLSASASEIFAAALQDYNRAVIVGTNTYGKATGQIVIPVEGVNSIPRTLSGEFVKITIEKFYRMNGKSHQLTGVIPDVMLPDYYSRLPITEKYSKNCLHVDSISKKMPVHSIEEPLPIYLLSEKSKKRISEHSNFRTIAEFPDNEHNRIKFRLQPYLFKYDFDRHAEWMENIEKASNRYVTSYAVKFPVLDASHLGIRPIRSEYLRTLADEIQHSIYIEEAYHIVNDLIDIHYKK